MGSVDNWITLEMIDIGMGEAVEDNVVIFIADSTSSSVLMAAFLPSSITSRLVMLPTEAVATALDLLKKISFLLESEVIPASLAIREP